ncbi:hypothetical protein A3C29_03020 [Candidatus Daviesbacteria bacterium RIFCSPHIGHO2_02_FULL_40_16]|nr:MAG: hypothetical protein A3C29_03020 [Candidatus Daviesbacteria bacterium RIFCSPHIGHO2_02_FULL_40_16]
MDDKILSKKVVITTTRRKMLELLKAQIKALRLSNADAWTNFVVITLLTSSPLGSFIKIFGELCAAISYGAAYQQDEEMNRILNEIKQELTKIAIMNLPISLFANTFLGAFQEVKKKHLNGEDTLTIMMGPATVALSDLLSEMHKRPGQIPVNHPGSKTDAQSVVWN